MEQAIKPYLKKHHTHHIHIHNTHTHTHTHTYTPHTHTHSHTECVNLKFLNARGIHIRM